MCFRVVMEYISRVTDQNGIPRQYNMLEIHHSGPERSNYISRVPDQNGVSLLCIMLEIHHSGREPAIWMLKD